MNKFMPINSTQMEWKNSFQGTNFHSLFKKKQITLTVLRASLVAQLVKNLPAMQETLVQFLIRKILQRRYKLSTSVFLGFPGGSVGKEPACNAGDLGLNPGLGRSPGGSRPGFDPWIKKIPGRRKRQPTPVFLPGKSYGWRSLVGYSPWGHKELDTTE